MYRWSIIGQMVPLSQEVALQDCLRWYNLSKWIPFRLVKGTLSSGASPIIVRPTGKELCVRFIWWSIIGGVCYIFDINRRYS